MAGSHLTMDPTTPDPDLLFHLPMKTKNRSHLTQSIINLTLEIMYLLTGERCAVVTVASVESLLHGMLSPVSGGWSRSPMDPSSHTPIPERNNEQKILEVTNKITELLTREVPIRYQDVAVSLSVEEWQYLEEHKELYKEAMMENQQLVTPTADDSNTGKTSEGVAVLNPELQTEDTPTAHTQPPRVPRPGDPSSPAEAGRIKLEIVTSDCHLEAPCMDTHVPSEPEHYRLIKSEIPTPDLGLHSLAPKTDPPNSEEAIHVKAEIVGPDCHSMLHSVVTPRTADLCVGLHSVAPLDIPCSPEESVPIKPEMPTADTRVAQPDPSNPEEHTLVKPEILTADGQLVPGFPLLDEPIVEESQIGNWDILSRFQNVDNLVTSNVQPGYRRVERSPSSPPNKERSVTQDVLPGFHSRGSSPSSFNARESSPDKLVNASLDYRYHAEESSPDNIAAAMLDIHPGLPGINRSPNYTTPEECPRDTLHRAPMNIHSGPLCVDVSSNHDGFHTSRARCGPCMVTSPYIDCLEECTPDKLAHFISNLKPGLADFFPDPPRSLEPSLKNRPRTMGTSPKSLHRFLKLHPKVPSRSVEPSGNSFSPAKPSSENRLKSEEPFSDSPRSTKPSPGTLPDSLWPSENPLSPPLIDPPKSAEPPPKRTKTIKHRIVYASDNIYPCSECKQQFVLKSDLIVHQKVHAGISGFTCPVCSKPFKGRAELSRHVRSHTGEKPFACSICGKCFTRRPNLFVHERIHRGEKPFTCSQCGRRFTHKQSYERHLMLHTDGVTFDCPDCGKDCTNKAGFLAHQRLHTRRGPDCGQPLISQALLRQQEAVHKDRKPFSCTKCVMAFPSQVLLVHHEVAHSPEESSSCSKPDEQFPGEEPVKRHKKPPAGRTSSCSECGKAFSAKSRLLLHQRIHRGGKPRPPPQT